MMKKVEEILKDRRIILATGVIVGIVLIVVIVSIMTAGYSVDLSKIYDVQFNGLDGEGKAKIIVNEQEQKNISNELGEYTETSEVMENFFGIEYEIVPSENLSNGDKVKVVAKYSDSFFEKYKIEFKNSEKEFTVDGLVVPQEIDVFEGLQVNCEGISPFITCTFDTTACGEFTKEFVQFESTARYYSVGEKIEVIATYEKDACVREKVKPIKEKMEYEIGGKACYMQSTENIDLSVLEDDLKEQLKLEYDSADELFCGVELGWTNHYTGVKEEQKKDDFCLVLREKEDFGDENPYNIYGMYYRIKIGVEHRSRGNEAKFDTEIDVLLLATNLYVDENNILHYDDLIQVKAEEVDGASNLMSEYIKEKQDMYMIR